MLERRILQTAPIIQKLINNSGSGALNKSSLGCGRYAPSPTGELHLGNLRTALLAWMDARLKGQTFVLRIDDLDPDRSKPRYVEQMIEDLTWLGIDWDYGPANCMDVGEYAQSRRRTLYDQVIHYLQQKEYVYPCICSRKDLADRNRLNSDGAVIYSGICRSKNNGIAPPREHALRFKIERKTEKFNDAFCGLVSCDLENDVGDFIVFRRDKIAAYHLAVVVDDILMGVSDVVRGADLLASTFQQIQIYQALGVELPNYGHLPLMLDTDGRKLSKRDSSRSIRHWIDRGKSKTQLVGYLASSVGLVEDNTECSATELLAATEYSFFVKQLSGL